MSIDIFYVTYTADADWFLWSLRVLRKNLTGYRDIHVVCPSQDLPLIYAAAGPKPIHIHPIPDWKGQGYHWQQWVKMNADKYTNADFIFHIDSDAYIKHPTDVMDFFRDGKPGWLWAYYSDLGNTVPWQLPTNRATELECPQEFMCGFPFIIHRDTYAKARDHMERVHGGSHEEYIRIAADMGGTSFSEFNVLGRLAWEYDRDKYAWVDRNREEWPKGFHSSRQFWSKAPISDHLSEIKAMMGEPSDPSAIRCTKMGHWIPSVDTHIGKWVEDAGRLDCDGYLLPRILPLIEPGQTIIDVGANIGDHAHAYAKAVLGTDFAGKILESGRVLAFEPNPIPFKCLERNMRGHGHVTCINKGLGSKEGKMGIAQSENVGASHLIPGDEVDIVTLDSYGLHRCDLVKIDAEGFELEVLKGASDTIERLRPKLVIEINKGALERQGAKPEDIYTFLTERGYRIEGKGSEEQDDIFCYP